MTKSYEKKILEIGFRKTCRECAKKQGKVDFQNKDLND
jgi:hypothetical protein